MDGEAGGSGAPLTAAHAPGLRGEPATRKGRQRDPPGSTGTPQHRRVGGDGGRAGGAPGGGRLHGDPPQELRRGLGVVQKQPGKEVTPPQPERRWRGLGGSGLSMVGSALGLWGGGDPQDPPRWGGEEAAEEEEGRERGEHLQQGPPGWQGVQGTHRHCKGSLSQQGPPKGSPPPQPGRGGSGLGPR